MSDVVKEKPHLTRSHILGLLKSMLRIRRFEEKCAELYTEEKIRGFLHLYIGEEAIAAGALIGSALSRPAPPPPYYDDYDAPPRYVVRRDVVVRRAPAYYAGGIEPWTRDWYEYCSDRYRSFNARTGTFTGYDGERHFCVAN